jgi:hypothetical protein
LTSARVEPRLAAVLAADVAGYSRLMGADERAIEINPNFSLGYGSCGTMLAYAGRGEESVRKGLYAMRLNPKDPSIFFRYTALSIAYAVQRPCAAPLSRDPSLLCVCHGPRISSAPRREERRAAQHPGNGECSVSRTRCSALALRR